MSQDVSDRTTTTADPLILTPVAALLGENCRKQEEAIQAIEDSAYVMRRGRRELQDPKRLALATNLRSKYMVDLATFDDRIRELDMVDGFFRELCDGLRQDVKAESPEVRQRIGRLLQNLANKYRAPSKNRDAVPGRTTEIR